MSSGPEKEPGLSGNEELYRFNMCIPTWGIGDLSVYMYIL